MGPLFGRIEVLLIAAAVLFCAHPDTSYSAQALSWNSGKSIIPSDNLNNNTRFGNAMAMCGGTLVIGARGGGINNAGAVYIYTRTSRKDPWKQKQKLTPNNPSAVTNFGYAVAMYQDMIVIGAPGFVRTNTNDVGTAFLYTRGKGGGHYSLTFQFYAPTGQGYGFGASVAIDRVGQVAIGATYFDQNGSIKLVPTYTGAVFLYSQLTSSGYTLEAEIKPSDDRSNYNNLFGAAVAVSDRNLAVGAPGIDNPDAAYFFRRKQLIGSGPWSQARKVTSLGNDNFGSQVVIAGKNFYIGAPSDSTKASNNGKVYVYVVAFTGGSYTKKAELFASDGQTNLNFGRSLAVSGKFLVVGGPGYSNGRGRVYVFSSDSQDKFTQVTTLDSPEAASGDNFGSSVAMDCNTIVVGANLKSKGAEHPNIGAAYSFDLSNPTLLQKIQTGICIRQNNL